MEKLSITKTVVALKLEVSDVNYIQNLLQKRINDLETMLLIKLISITLRLKEKSITIVL